MAERVIAGLACSDMLVNLIDLTEGNLTPEAEANVAAHLAGCPDCARFGEIYTRVVARLAELSIPEAASDLDALPNAAAILRRGHRG
jgi:anti-sigma factor RsiW